MSVPVSSATVQKITLDRIIQMIEACGGKGVDLSGQDLSMIDLSCAEIEKKLRIHHFNQSKELPVWASRFAQGRSMLGLNLRGANLSGANLRLANLTGVDFTRANLRGASLHDACLQYANLYHADLEGAILRRADLRFARAGGANLRGTSLYRVQMEDTTLHYANLEDANLVMAKLEGAQMTRSSLGEHLLIEDPRRFAEAVKREGLWRNPGEWELYMPRRLEYLKDIYIALKSSFSQHGQYSDASWAYYQEQKINRILHTPGKAQLPSGAEVPVARRHDFKWWQFQVSNFFLWLGYWCMEVSCGYGEKPWRSAGLAIAVILLFPLFYMASGGVQLAGNVPPGLLDYWIYSLGALVTLTFPRFLLTNPLAEFLTGIEGLIGVAILALLMFTLGNRISRS
jgi:uncharacterized protein YjbI with pentapeptide repeats